MRVVGETSFALMGTGAVHTIQHKRKYMDANIQKTCGCGQNYVVSEYQAKNFPSNLIKCFECRKKERKENKLDTVAAILAVQKRKAEIKKR